MRRLTGGGVVLAALTCAGLAACNGHLTSEGFFVKGPLRYRVAAPDAQQWEQLKFAENDLAWVSRTSGHVLSTNATCDEHGDPGLEVLTTHLLFGFTDKALKSRETKMIDGREALHSRYVAKLDGVPVEIEATVLKKNNCVHDFIYISPVGRAEEYRAAYERLVAHFTAQREQG